MKTTINKVHISPTITGDFGGGGPQNDTYPSEWTNLNKIPTSTIQETIESDASGTKTIYYLSHNPIICKVFIVFINGILQRYNIDFTLDKNKITFTDTVLKHSNIIVTYSYVDIPHIT